MANKPLVIDSRTGLPAGESGKWTPLTNMAVFIRDIVTNQLTNTANVGELVSGIPTPFARIDLFKTAIDVISGNQKIDGGLNTYYSTLVNEWKGFIAAIALDYTKFSVRRVEMAYSDGGDRSTTSNLYEPLGAFGNMLLERRPLWCSPGSNVPFIDVIKYNGQVVGGTSPESLIFTSVGYDLKSSTSHPWISKEGKFTDPLEGDLTEGDLCALYAYLRHLLNNLNRVKKFYKDAVPGLDPEYANVLSLLQDWHKKMEAYAVQRHFNLESGSVPPVDIQFDAPFSYLFNFKDVLYGKDGILTTDADGDAILFDPKKALLPKESEIARVILDPIYDQNPARLSELPVYVLKAPIKDDPGHYAFFALPLSALGLNVFGRNVGALAGVAAPGNSLTSTLTAIYDEAAPENNLEVTLSLVTTDGKTRIFKEAYTVRNDKSIFNRDIILWPNFISRQWNRYFLYSEMPHDAKSADYPYRAMPFVADEKSSYTRILVDKDSEPVYLASNGEVKTHYDKESAEELLKAKLLVRTDSRMADNAYKYEIYESNLPFKGVRLQSQTGKEGGFLMINYTSDRGGRLPVNMASDNHTLNNAVLGIDFGSTNTSVAYFDPFSNRDYGIEFENRRVSLLAPASDGNRNINPSEKQIFFFQGGGIKSNAIKSILTLHNPRRLRVDDEGSETLMLSREVKGGFPSFSSSLPISQVDEDTIKLKFPGCGLVSQIHNMKWNTRDVDIAHKETFLRSLMLQVYAEMFANNYVPTELKWSYPSAMGINMLIQYRRLWENLKDISPIVDRSIKILKPLDSNISFGNDDVFGAPNSGNSDPFGGGSDPFGGADPFGGNADPFGGVGATDPFAVKNQPAVDPFSGENPFGGSDPFAASANTSAARPAAKTGNNIPDLLPDDQNKSIEFKPKKLPADRSLTEACAVASYMTRKVNAGVGDILTLCFDIGGSTTDFSAIARLQQGITMIKQNSIRFAAKLVADATSYAPNFKQVIDEVCARHHLKVMGVNAGTPAYSPTTAPYFFEQIVDRLTPEQLPDFYALIAAKCPELMSVNLYVTGLITFYAGQIAAKLIREVQNSPDNAWGGKPVVQVVFAGKGSRIFEWFSTTQPEMAKQYYMRMFMEGMGGQQKMVELLSNWPNIRLSEEANPDVKFEVSKGLAMSSRELFVPEEEVVIEIIGESGFKIQRPDGSIIELQPDNSITPQMMRHIGTYFKAPQSTFNSVPCENFKRFAGLFYRVASQCFNFAVPVQVFNQGFANMNIDGYIRNYPDYSQALDREMKKPGDFDFVAPIIILEGEKFYKDYLLPNLNR